MATRFFANAGRIIMSKPGYNAAPSTPDSFKIFDSDWGAGNVLITSGTMAVSEGNTYTVSFPAQSYIPAVDVMFFELSGGVNRIVGSGGVTVTTSGFSFLAPNNATHINYEVYGVAV